MYSELDVCGGLDPLRTCETIMIRGDVMISEPLSVHVMPAAGTLPSWIQKSWRKFPSLTTVLLGLTRNESRISRKRQSGTGRQIRERKRE